MKKLAATFVVLALCLATVPAFAQAPVNIVYPIHGETYPIMNPAPGPLSSHYFTSSFSVTCQGDHDVEWGFDTTTVGKAVFYDMFSAQFVYKLPGGSHEFWVKSDCGDSAVKFKIGN
jgi:hypothetical protein